MQNQKSKIKNEFKKLTAKATTAVIPVSGTKPVRHSLRQQAMTGGPKANSGFTLIEIMVAVSIFAIVMLVAIGAVLSIVSANRKAQALNSVINNLNFALEGMTRDLRTGYDYVCEDVLQVDCHRDGTENISFHSSQYLDDVQYSLLNGSISKQIGSGDSVALTGQEVEISSLKFYVANTAKASEGDFFQPKIIITIGGEFKGFGTPTKFNLQTMVTQRKLDI